MSFIANLWCWIFHTHHKRPIIAAGRCVWECSVCGEWRDRL